MPPADPSLNCRLAEKKKEEGNLSYTAKNYQQALGLYSQAIGKLSFRLSALVLPQFTDCENKLTETTSQSGVCLSGFLA